MSEYNIIRARTPLITSTDPNGTFFERYCTQYCNMQKTGLDFTTIWFQFCKVNNLEPKKPWQISNYELKNLNRLTDHEIFLLIAEGIGRFWKGDYKGDGF